jgi:hypothetical protein
MAAYLRDYQEELRRVGDVVFKQRHRSPVLIVVGKAAELVGESKSADRTMIASRAAIGAQQVALLDRVFPVTKASHAPRGPVQLGRSADNDVPMPEYSISKRQCQFHFEAEGTKITDCGSTNGTIVGGNRLEPGQSVLIQDGTKVSLGRFAFVFRSAAGFHAFVKSSIH